MTLTVINLIPFVYLNSFMVLLSLIFTFKTGDPFYEAKHTKSKIDIKIMQNQNLCENDSNI